MVSVNTSIAYLIGLIVGKGYIEGENKVSIEFPFANEVLEGIAHCPLCGYLATKPPSSSDGYLLCKNKTCKNSKIPSIDSQIKKLYNQSESFQTSIHEVIIPFLNQGIHFNSSIVSNSNCTFITLTLDSELYLYIKNIFNPATNFTSMRIPNEMWLVEPDEKIEVINGLLDTIGFPNAGGWIPRDGRLGHGRMRAYFQIVNRNYYLPVSIDNYIRDNFNLPIQTIDSGHPNIRDANLKDFMQGKKSAYGREHQVKFFPEYYQRFKFRISSKQGMFRELLEHNLDAGFDSEEDWFPSSVREISEDKIKATHPMETNLMLDKNVRTHVDAFWQINLKMGCKYVNSLKDKAANKDLFEVTGISGRISNPENKLARFRYLPEEKKISILNQKVFNTKTQKKSPSGKREADTYPLLVDWLEKYIKENMGGNSVAYDTSSQTLSQFSSSEFGDFDSVLELEDKDIRPDVVGFTDKTNEYYFIESKIVALGLKELGQLMGYCHVAHPREAFLITTETISAPLIKAIQRNRKIIVYGNEQEVKFGRLNGTTVEFIEL